MRGKERGSLESQICLGILPIARPTRSSSSSSIDHFPSFLHHHPTLIIAHHHERFDLDFTPLEQASWVQQPIHPPSLHRSSLPRPTKPSVIAFFDSSSWLDWTLESFVFKYVSYAWVRSVVRSTTLNPDRGIVHTGVRDERFRVPDLDHLRRFVLACDDRRTS